MMVAFAGVVVVAGAPTITVDKLPSLLLIIGASFMWASSNVIIKKMGTIDAFQLNGWMAVLATPQLAIASFFLESDQIAKTLELSWYGIAGIVYNSVVVVIIGYAMWYFLLKRYSVNQTMPLTLSFYLSGGCVVDNDGLTSSIEEVAGKSYLYCLPNTAEIENYPAKKRIQRVSFQISSELLQTFGDWLYELPIDIRQAVEQPEKAKLHCPSSITPIQRQILQQIFRCPFQGLTRQIYLEAKVLELLALQLEQLNAAPKSNKLPADDITSDVVTFLGNGLWPRECEAGATYL